MCDFRVQSCRHRARRGLLVLVAGTFHCRKTGGEPDGCVNPTRQSTSLQALAPDTLSATSPVVPLAAATGVLQCALLPWRAPSSHKHTAALVGGPFRSETTPPTRPTSPAAAALSALIDAARCVPKTMGFDIRRRHGTTTTHPRKPGTRRARAARTGETGACAFTVGGSPGDHPERNQVHTVSLPQKKKQSRLSIQTRKEDNGLSKDEDLSAPGRRQLPPQGCTRPRQHPHRV